MSNDSSEHSPIEYRQPTPLKANLACGVCGREFSEQVPQLGYIYPLPSDPTRRAGANACGRCFTEQRKLQLEQGLIVPLRPPVETTVKKRGRKIGA